MIKLKEIFQPFGKVNRRLQSVITIAWISLLLILFQVFHTAIIPPPLEIITAFWGLLQSTDFYDDFVSSLLFTIMAMLYSLGLTMLLVYLSRIPAFRVFAQIVSKLRYLTITGIVFLLAVLTPDLRVLKLTILLFGVVPYFVTSFLSVVERDEVQQQLNKAFTNRQTRWSALYEIIIVGKLDELFEVLRQNFAIAWMMITTAEGYDMASGGIGTMMLKDNKQMHLPKVFAVLLAVLLIGILFDWGLRRLRPILFKYLRTAG